MVELGAYVSTIGPKSRTRHEAPPELVDRASVFAIDHPDQVGALDEPFFSNRSPVSLAAVLDRSAEARRTDDDITAVLLRGFPAGDPALLRAIADQ